jgi:hypothetical protein
MCGPLDWCPPRRSPRPLGDHHLGPRWPAYYPPALLQAGRTKPQQRPLTHPLSHRHSHTLSHTLTHVTHTHTHNLSLSYEHSRTRTCPPPPDFGLSLVLEEGQESVTASDHGAATAMAPEVLSQRLVSKAADVYSFGVLLWQVGRGTRRLRARLGSAAQHRPHGRTSRMRGCDWRAQGGAKLQTLFCQCSGHARSPARHSCSADVTQSSLPIAPFAGAIAIAPAPCSKAPCLRLRYCPTFQICTGEQPWRGMTRATLLHAVCVERRRLEFGPASDVPECLQVRRVQAAAGGFRVSWRRISSCKVLPLTRRPILLYTLF